MSKLEKYLNDIIKIVEEAGLLWKWSTYKGRKVITIYESESVRKVKYTIDDVMKEILFMKEDIKELKTDVTELKTDVTELKTDVTELKTDVKGIHLRIDNLVELNELKEVKQ